MKKVLVLGAGMVARPLVRYLLDVPGFQVVMATRTVSKAHKILDGHPQGVAEQLDVEDLPKMERLVSESDLTISLLPYIHHVTVAKFCLAHRKHCVTTSYVSDNMRALDGDAKAAGVILLNELGLDPGIDHMSAMKIIHDIRQHGGKVESFRSYCGGLPAPEANTNPWGYKFSWSPVGVVRAGKNNARYLKDGQEVKIPGPELFSHYWILPIEGVGDLEAYPNRDSIPYIELYGLQGVSTMYRGTLRYKGWCNTWKAMVDLGLIDENPMELTSRTYAAMMRQVLAKKGVNGNGQPLRQALAEHLKLTADADPLKRWDWLGLLSDQPLPDKLSSPFDILCDILNRKLQYEPQERDMIALKHEFIAAYGDRREKIESVLVDFGVPGGDTSMGRTVGLPAAVGAKMILQGKINLSGVYIPVLPEIYEPVLGELEGMGLRFQDKVTKL